MKLRMQSCKRNLRSENGFMCLYCIFVASINFLKALTVEFVLHRASGL